jgi:hypothetical protein
MTKIRSLLLLACVVLTASSRAAFSQQTGGTNAPFTLEITPNHIEGQSDEWDFANSTEGTVKVGQMIVIGIRKKNTSNHEVFKAFRGLGTVEVRDSNGNLVGTKVDNPDLLPLNGGPMHPAHIVGTKDNVLQPGEIDLTQAVLFDGREGQDMSKPGTYTVQLLEHISNDPASEMVKSNTITITVLPVDEPPPAQK